MRDNKFTRQMRLFNQLQALGFTFEECESLRRIEMTLQRWGEGCCGDSNAYASWSIERGDNGDGKPFRVTHWFDGRIARVSIPDREAGALKRLQAICEAINGRRAQDDSKPFCRVFFYHQTDPRGCALYVVDGSAIPQGATLDSCYTNGIAVTA